MTTDGTQCAGPARAEPRMRVLLAAELRTETSRTSCRVVDLSRGGACLELDGPMTPGREVMLHSEAMCVPATVMWLDGPRCGVMFARPMRATQLLVQMSQSRKSKVAPEPIPFSAGARFPSRSS